MSVWIKLGNERRSLRFKKALMRAGTWVMGNGKRFTAARKMYDHLVKTHQDLTALGVKTPLVLGHDGTSAYGDIVDLVIDTVTNDAGQEEDVLSMIVEFKDEQAKREALRNDVSAYVPPSRKIGNGSTFSRALEHVALTPWPVIHGLADWETIAASFSDTETPIVFDDLITLLGIDASQATSDEEKKALVEDAVKMLAEEATKMKEELDKLKGDKPADPPADAPADPAVAASLPRPVILQLGKARKTELDALVTNLNITPASRDELVKRYCSEASVRLSLEDDADDGFDALIAALSKNKVMSNTGRSLLDDAIELSHGGNDSGTKRQTLAENAKARAEAK